MEDFYGVRPCGLPPHTRGWTGCSSYSYSTTPASPAHAGMDLRRPLPAGPAHRFPRTRGDGPQHVGLRGEQLPLPPHTRGWTARSCQTAASGVASPAHAGMDPRRRLEGGLLDGFPRTRGDGPDAARGVLLPTALPPHTRGWTPLLRRVRPTPRASPAHAGMDLLDLLRPLVHGSFPRTRGDGPCVPRHINPPNALPPHTRGWTRGSRYSVAAWRASPAHAGMDRYTRLAARARVCFPRTRGDGPTSAGSIPKPSSLPPHTRGWTHEFHNGLIIGSASPAHAGMDRSSARSSTSSFRFPRTRGDGPVKCRSLSRMAALPPHTRGWTQAQHGDQHLGRASPAHAGMDPAVTDRLGWANGFPRTRGDGPESFALASESAWLPPHTRGWTLDDLRPESLGPASPAHAGMDRWTLTGHPISRRFPRTRGDGPHRAAVLASSAMLPPHTRGWTSWRRADHRGQSASPAHAGMDPTPRSTRAWWRRFPRTRGDGPQDPGGKGGGTMLPPHTRGWTVAPISPMCSLVASPAHAGMDLPSSSQTGRASCFPRTRGDGTDQ